MYISKPAEATEDHSKQKPTDSEESNGPEEEDEDEDDSTEEEDEVDKIVFGNPHRAPNELLMEVSF